MAERRNVIRLDSSPRCAWRHIGAGQRFQFREPDMQLIHVIMKIAIHLLTDPVSKIGFLELVKKQMIRTRLPQGKPGPDHIGLVRATGLEPARCRSGT